MKTIPFLLLTFLGACAADVGDPSKEQLVLTENGEKLTSPSDAAIEARTLPLDCSIVADATYQCVPGFPLRVLCTDDLRVPDLAGCQTTPYPGPNMLGSENWCCPTGAY
jgi:hypothetical protein